MVPARFDPTQLGLAKVTEYGVRFETGRPVAFPYIHNTDKSPNFGKRYGQHEEPAGFFMLHRYGDHPPPRMWTVGTMHFTKPIVMKMSLDEHIYGPTGWKARLAKYTGKKRLALSRYLISHGYDGIVTVRGGETSEIVKLIG